MSSSSNVLAGEVATLVRPLEGRLCGDASSDASEDAAEELDLPQCKIKRNYNCAKCTFYTQNPRAFLVHTRDTHFEKFKIYDCPHCVYASRHHQKLVRHLKMVHVGPAEAAAGTKAESELYVSTEQSADQIPIEDLLEEVEECEDIQMDVEDGNEELLERSAEVDFEGDRTNADENSTEATKDKTKFFSCSKCNYVTHIKTRFNKHVKYHSMPMIKCTMCDFRTPYKWNLDRHMKNHGGTGSFHCSMCNFTADIKQSLTVHEMNHHTPPVGQSGSSRRRNRVGGSDILHLDCDDASDLIIKEEEGSGDSRSSHSASELGSQDAAIEMVSCNSESNDVAIDIPIKKENLQLAYEVRNPNSPVTTEEMKLQKHNKKNSRPIPQLIPLNASTPNQSRASSGEPPQKRFKESINSESTDSNSGNKLEEESSLDLISGNTMSAKETPLRKKNESFFDKLKERLLTESGDNGSLICKSCGFESKCLSEHSVHVKNCTAQSNRVISNAMVPNLSSTRCQNCRHRCKSSADLYVHMQTCQSKATNTHSVEITNQDSNDEITTSQHEKETEPHPMENVVFVWNKIDRDVKFDTPLDISINDDSTLPEHNRSFDSEHVDENESMNLSPSQAIGKKVFKCPDCVFWASTASRFHVHIVGHLNKKPFECSLCRYKSNWRWDITKHIKLKSARDPEHNEAKVLMTDETGRRNYSKYNKFLAISILNENGENEFHYIDQNASFNATMEVDETLNETNDNMNSSFEIQPLNLQTQQNENKYDTVNERNEDSRKPKKTLWKCKKCNYKDPSKEALLDHVRSHSKIECNQEDLKANKKTESTTDPADLAYRCGHCNQLSNWKHVIQRHCRLKHDGVIKVITTVKPKPDTPATWNDTTNDNCTKCPFKTNDKKSLVLHMQQHQPSPQSIFKCYFCPFFVKNETELMHHLTLHGVNDPEEYISKAMGCKSPLPDQQGPSNGNSSNAVSTKRHKCIECPYETNSKSQFMYHEQFHRLSADTPYKCQECNYGVSKRHLLHQHMKVHGIITKKNEMDTDIDANGQVSHIYKPEDKVDAPMNLEEIPYVWVSARNEFHKMYKCRYCSYVNSQKCKIPNHEKIHCLFFENSELVVYKCLECKFTCDNAMRLAEHSKTHGEIYGRIYCSVESDIPDEEQIAKLRKVIEVEKGGVWEGNKEDGTGKNGEHIKILYFCQKCPARFFSESELKVHDKFHDTSYYNKCTSCDFSVSQNTDLEAHIAVHSDEYQTKTKMLKFVNNSHPAHREPQLKIIQNPTTSEITWIVTNPCKNFNYMDCNRKITDVKHVPKQYYCKECPAKFFKTSALNYHMGLHGSDSEHKCKKCSYAVKNIGNLAKHELLHESEGKGSTCDYESGEDMDYKNIPLSGTDLFQRKTEAQKRVLINKDKLVKPNDHFPPVLQADPQFGYLMHGNPEFIYPTYLKNGRQKEKRYKCHKCPSAFEKREQYKIHLSLHGSKQRYKCELCDYSVKYYANYVQHMRKHQMNDEAQAERKKVISGFTESENQENQQEENADNIKLAIKTMPKGTPRSDFQQFSIGDQQTLRLLQHRRSVNYEKEDTTNETSPTKDRKVHMCLLCPYTNQRQDALTNHYRRHDDTDVLNKGGNYKCSFCDLIVFQSHILREHLKTHFNYQKHLTAECYVANEDVVFTISKIEDDGDVPTDLKIDIKKRQCCNEDKILVNIKTGEILAD